MQKLIFHILLLTLTPKLCAQTGFNQIHDYGLPLNQFDKVIVHNDTIVGCGIAWAGMDSNQQCIFIARLDTNGVHLDHTLICDSLGGHLSMAHNWSDLKYSPGGGYIITAASYTRYDGIFIKLNNKLEKVIQKEYVDSVSLVEFYTSVINVQDGYILGGYIQQPNYERKGIVHKVDLNGNTEYRKLYGAADEDNVFRRVFTINDSIIAGVGGFKNKDSLLYSSWIGIIHQKTGQLIKQWKPIFSPSNDFIHFLITLSPQEWLLNGVAAKYDLGTQNILAQNYITRIDTNFQTLTRKEISPIDSKPSYLYGIDFTTDGNLVSAGYRDITTQNGVSYRAGWISKFNMYGDTIWNRLDRAEINNQAVQTSLLNGLGVLPSGNIIAGGYAGTGTQIVCWLIKVSNDGCIDTLDCAVVPAHEPPLLLEERVPATQVFPNPARDLVQVKLSPAAFGKAEELCLYDMYGRLVLRQPIPPGERQPGVSLAGLDPGVYHWRLTARGNIPGETGTLVLAR